MKLTLTIVAGCLLSISPSGSFAQAPANSATAAPVSYSSISELNQIIANLQSASQTTQQDLSHLRIEKWKTDSNTKKQTQSDAESIMRNLQNALPSILADLKNSPENLALTFKTYRNLDALYDVMNSVVESAGAFGNKEEFQSLNNDLGAVENSRRAFAERMDKLASAKETEIGQLRTELQAARAATPPKKVVVDDSESAPKKTPPKKKPVPKPKSTPVKAAPSSGTPPSQ
jgi:DNA repair exonuclease SbcCD ATPase subunit